MQRRVLDILDSVDAAICETGRDASEVTPALALARERITNDTLQLSVVGAEGHGKSTLLNALFGAKLSEIMPTDLDRPATVAPVELRWGDLPNPHYAVDLLGPQIEAKPCTSEREFSHYLLQRYNPGNSKRVSRGIVHLNHDYLKRGLKVIDTPGIDGVDEDIRSQVAADLHSYTNAIVAVTRDRRGHGAISSIFDTYKINPNRALVVINVDAEYMDAGRAKTEGTSVSSIIEAKRAGLVEMLAQTGVTIDPARVFVVCLPIMSGQIEKSAQKVDPAHSLEIEKLLAAIWTLVQEQSLETVVHDAIDLALDALVAADQHLLALEVVLETVLDGDKDKAEYLAMLETSVHTALTRARHIADAGLFDPARLETEIEQCWQQHLSGPVRESGKRTAQYLNQKIAGVDAMQDVSATDAAAMRQEIEDFARETSVPLDLARNKGLWEFLESICAQANRIVSHVYSAALELDALAQAGHRVSVKPESLPYLRLTRTRPDLFAYAWKVGVPVGGGVLAASLGSALTLAGALSHPMVAIPVLFILGGGAGWYTASRMMGGRKGDLTRFLTERLRTLDGMGGDPKGPLYDQWQFVCLKVAHLVELNLDEALTNIGRLLRTDDKSLSDMSAQRTQIEVARNQIAMQSLELRRMMALSGQER
jgi:GTPase SAR1 family protein